MAVGSCLVVEGDGRVRRSVVSVLGQAVPSVEAGTLQDALGHLEANHTLQGLIVSFELPDGSGVELLRAFRAVHRREPALVLVSAIEPAFVNEVHDLGGRCACKPDIFSCLKQFRGVLVKRTSRVVRKVRAFDGRRLDALAKTSALSLRERQLVELLADGVPRSHLSDALGVAESTVKSRVRAVLRKTGQRRLSSVVEMVRAGSTRDVG